MANACAQFTTTQAGETSVIGLSPLPVAPGQACPADSFVLLDPATAAAVVGAASAPSSSSLPPSTDLAAAWGASFVLVVGCYVIARYAGAVVSMLK